jgi:hypothetical protein
MLVSSSIHPSSIERRGAKIEPRIVSRPAFMVAGLKYHGKNQKNEIPHDDHRTHWLVLLSQIAPIGSSASL